MLIYNPAFDVSHAAFRFLTLFRGRADLLLETERACLLDFFFCFPSSLRSIRLTVPLRKRLGALAIREQYGAGKDERLVFLKIAPIQHTALSSLVAKGFFDRDLFASGKLKPTRRKIPAPLAAALDDSSSMQAQLLSFLLDDLSNIELNGKDGLKDRTGLMEYRYDLNAK